MRQGTSVPDVTPVNRLLQTLPRRQRARFVENCDSVDLAFGNILCEPEMPFRHIYFPLTGFISVMAEVAGHPPLELGLIGNEGMLGATLALQVRTAPLLGMVQGPGTALRMTAVQFQRELGESAKLHNTLNRYMYVLMAQLSQSGGCMRFHDISARLARWLLMIHDRAHSDQFHLTHQFLADMLGVQRSAVTIAAGVLQRKRIIRYIRGAIRVLDRQGLEAVSCECYKMSTADYDRIFH
jgi:CRP-like cAMP-binding protein